MKKTAFIIAIILFTIGSSFAKDAPLLVTAEWLAANISDPNLVLFHVGDKTEYDKGHIPGARYIALRNISISRDNDKISTELPSPEALKTTLEKFGVSTNSRIVIYYGNDWITPTTRVYFTLDYLGLSGQTSILNGGMKAWTQIGKATTTDIPTPAVGSLRVNPRPDVVADADWLKTQLENRSVSVIDARTSNFYDGTSVGFRPRGGHIKNARSVPFTSLINEDGTVKSPEEIKKIFADANIDGGDTVVSYCHVGQQASLVYFAARSIGLKAKLYDGSFEEWAERADLPVDDPKRDTRGTTIQFVSPDWLAPRTGDANLRVIDARNNVYDYFIGHVPNAVHLADAVLRAPRGGMPTQYLDPFLTSRLLLNAGIKKEDRVVIYSDGAGVLGATMLAYVLERLGMKQVFILDGGIESWKEKNAVVKEYPKYESAPNFDGIDNRSVRVSLDEVKSLVGNGKVKFVDARPTENYTGEANVWVRNGHIPGAISIPWKTLMDDKNPHKLGAFQNVRKIIETAGLTKDDDIVVYCGTSREASLEYVLLKHVLGFPKVRLYEGSWAEYATVPELPVETGSK